MAGCRTPCSRRAAHRCETAREHCFATPRAGSQSGRSPIDGIRAALALYREANDHAGISDALCSLAIAVGVFAGDRDGNRRYARKRAATRGSPVTTGCSGGRSGGSPPDRVKSAGRCLSGEASCYPAGELSRGGVALLQRRLHGSNRRQFRRSKQLPRERAAAAGRVEDPFTTKIILSNIGLAHLLSGDLDRSRDAFEQALRLCAEHDFASSPAKDSPGWPPSPRHKAARKQRRGCAARPAAGNSPATYDTRIDDRLERDYLAAARTRYGDIAWGADEQAGARLSRAEAIAYALGERSEALQTAN